MSQMKIFITKAPVNSKATKQNLLFNQPFISMLFLYRLFAILKSTQNLASDTLFNLLNNVALNNPLLSGDNDEENWEENDWDEEDEWDEDDDWDDDDLDWVPDEEDLDDEDEWEDEDGLDVAEEDDWN